MEDPETNPSTAGPDDCDTTEPLKEFTTQQTGNKINNPFRESSQQEAEQKNQPQKKSKELSKQDSEKRNVEVVDEEEWQSIDEVEQDDQIPILMNDYYKSFKQLVEQKGFAYECHTVQTEDGYILNMFRIQQRRFLNIRKKPAVLLMHGLLSSADTWVINQEEDAPAF